LRRIKVKADLSTAEDDRNEPSDRKSTGCPKKGHGRSTEGRRLPAGQSLYLTEDGPVVSLGTPPCSGTVDVPAFNQVALIAALRTDQAGNSTFPEFLAASWQAGVVRYEVDLVARKVAYYGCNGEEYIESYPAVEVE
jgi:uncharacterized protein YbcV (DUF1398 family)